MKDNDNTKDNEQEFTFRVVLKSNPVSGRAYNFYKTAENGCFNMSESYCFDAAGWDTWDEMPGFVMFTFDNDDTVLINKDCIVSISILPKK